ncbi:MAG TPA: IS1 family transposase [Pyrinomonadaceae bacterium]|jgi:transposase-like protein/IS1 family transposase|nr:IS1 family transposase [Pyrinomonadaceae bacterium]
MTCHNCQIVAVKIGKDRKGNQRFRCNVCRKTFQASSEKRIGNMYLPVEKAVLCLKLLVEGNSIRSTERITGVNRNTILDLLVLTGEKCERLLNEKIEGLAVNDVQADEMWGFVGMKEKTKKRQLKHDATLGDAYTFVAIERNTKLVLAWHLGRRGVKDTVEFTEKIERATSGRFQLTTDGFAAYPDAVSYSLGTRVDFAQLIKIYAQPEQGGGERRYSPAQVVEALPKPRIGNPDPERICTSHVERQNLTMRMMMRRLTRLTNAFSKKWENLRAALALHFAYYNFCRIHKTIRCTPAMEAGITKTVWSLEDLLMA